MKFLLLSFAFAFGFSQVEAGLQPPDCKCITTKWTVGWTVWYDGDDPSATGDWENLSGFNSYPVAQRPCGGRRILCMEYRIKSNNTCWFAGRPDVLCASEANTVFYMQSATAGLACRNKDQHYVPVGNTFKQSCCCDYEVRYMCAF